MRKPLLVLAFIFFIFVLCGVASQEDAAETPASWAAPGHSQLQQRRNERDDSLEKMQKERTRRINKERHERVKRDTDKLLALATELKQYVDKSNENILSLDVMRKADEIEKLAHQVRQQMKSEP